MPSFSFFGMPWRPSGIRRAASLTCLSALLMGMGSLGPLSPQPARAADEKAEEPPDPSEEELETKDGVALGVTYYGSLLGKHAVPIILLHGYKGDRRDYDALALYLQSLGHAVIVPDLRGHGDSTTMIRPGSNINVNLDASKLRKDGILAMSAEGGDLEAVKKFLMKKNNAGELNIEKLCVIGADMGATVALNWAATDWSWPLLPGRKQGQDVKALVLISPEWAFQGVPITAAINSPAVRQTLSIMMIVGSGDSGSMKDSSRIMKSFEKYRAPPPTDPKEAEEKQDLFLQKVNTSLSGTKMLGEASLKLNERIGKFIELRLVNKKFPWTDRSNKLGSG